MAAIITRRLKDGQKRYFAQITRREFNYQETGPRYDTKKKAEKWAKVREEELDEDLAAGRQPKKRSDKRKTLGDAIDRYITGPWVTQRPKCCARSEKSAQSLNCAATA